MKKWERKHNGVRSSGMFFVTGCLKLQRRNKRRQASMFTMAILPIFHFRASLTFRSTMSLRRRSISSPTKDAACSSRGQEQCCQRAHDFQVCMQPHRMPLASSVKEVEHQREHLCAK